MTLTRRESLKLMAMAALATTIPGCGPSDVERATDRVVKSAGQLPLADREPTVLSRHEYETVKVLVDLIIPADDQSVSATDAGVPAFIDFILEETDGIEEPLKEGLAWLDQQTTSDHSSSFITLDDSQQTAFLDRIAWPDDVEPGLEEGAEFFTLIRDLTASGFWSSKIGVDDLGYAGNTPQAYWEGCSHDAMAHLGLEYPAS